MNQRRVGATLLVILVVTLGVSAWLWWRTWSAPLVEVVFRPPFSIHGIAEGSPVRLKGVLVGQVSTIGLSLDDQGEVRPEVTLSLNPESIADRGLALRLQSQNIKNEVAAGLRAQLVAVSPASGLLQVELYWDETDPLPASLKSNEIPATGVTLQRATERIVKELGRFNQRDLGLVARDLDQSLSIVYEKTDPAFAAEFSQKMVLKTTEILRATEESRLEEKVHRLAEACASLRRASDRANQQWDSQALVDLHQSIQEAQTSLEGLAITLEDSQTKLSESVGDFTGIMQAVSRVAKEWTAKTRSLTTEPQHE